MSHFAVLIIHEEDESIDSMLEPYYENLNTDFMNVEDDSKEKYATDTLCVVYAPDGTWKEKYLYKRMCGGKAVYSIPNGYVEKEVPISELYPSFDEYMDDYCGYTYDKEHGWGYWYNINAKWDWYEIGGRFSGSLVNKRGCEYDELPLEEWDIDRLSNSKRLYNKFKNEWNEMAAEDFSNSFLKKEYMIDRYVDADTYAKLQTTEYFHSVITPDGEWHEVGKMGWFGCSSESGEEFRDWIFNFKDRFYSPYIGKGYIATVVDCHI